MHLPPGPVYGVFSSHYSPWGHFEIAVSRNMQENVGKRGFKNKNIFNNL
jgi:hypothetical protein